MNFTDRDGRSYFARTPVELVRQLHDQSHTPCETDQDYMAEASRRAKIADGVTIRCDTAENFVADLLTHGLLQQPTNH